MYLLFQVSRDFCFTTQKNVTQTALLYGLAPWGHKLGRKCELLHPPMCVECVNDSSTCGPMKMDA
ncbi:hypothetical protein HYDPIDRAFT_118035 [Hydnomerulius pinastri MD-312]|uniref:Uncharacterized protein n=1 Tax=Hydnomerulius pinastri MD-312 TaxID=994086 RepID=A0A0C9WA07_9AGAM|nr:hypothetical protein HYDPIDRAFT_118035 [Hydnomerulius pinastri MD-312]